MKSYVGMRKYRTHPLVKAALLLSWLLTAFAVAGAYLLNLYTDAVVNEYESARAAARYEAYLSLSSSIDKADLWAAGEAMSRYIIFSDGDVASAELLRDRLLAGDVSDRLIKELSRILDAERADYDDAVAESARCAERMADSVAALPSERAVELHGWEVLRDCGEVRETIARKTARRFIDGGVTLTQAENHGFPLVYSYTCENAAADVTRMGGRLLRMWVYRVGDAEEKGDAACREAAVGFVRDTGIADAVVYEEVAEDNEVSYVFCRRVDFCGVVAVDVRSAVNVVVTRAGARVSFFDAGDYYRHKTRAAVRPEMRINREKACEMTGEVKENLMLIIDGGELFWCVSGAKNLLLDAKTGEIKVKNP